MPVRHDAIWPPAIREHSEVDDYTRDTDAPPELVEALLAAYQRRLDEDYPDDDPREITLYGECLYNAPVVAREISERGLTPWLAWGVVLTDPPREGFTVADAEAEMMPVHFWIEVECEGERWVLDLASERGVEAGLPRIYRGRPPEYHVPEDGLIDATDPVPSGHLRGVEGYDALVADRRTR